MEDTVRDLHKRAEEMRAKYNDDELFDYMMTLASRLEQLEMLRHQFGYFLMHAQAVVPYDACPRHYREALDRARKVLRDTSGE